MTPSAVSWRIGSQGGHPEIRALSAAGLVPAASTPGLVRELAFDTPGAMLVRARAEGGVASGWHHHGDREVLGHVIRGSARFEFGPDGRETANVEAGGFFHVPCGLVHRDVNPSDEPQEIILCFVGAGTLVVNVDGPAPG